MSLERLGPYKLQKILGRGGMGAVYVGVHEETGEQAAVKVLSGHLADDAAFRDRFQQEVESLKRLLHPNIVQLVGYGEEDGHLFYAMELVEGRNLQDELLSGRRFTWREAARIGVEVATALKHAHDRGIIHRDLKPANLMLDVQDHVKLTDFGIAKLYGGANVTAAGGVLGTADYMSPEQAEGKQVTTRCDLYSLGSVLYALLCGRPPFGGKSVLEVVTALKAERPVPICRLAPETPQAFEEIIEQLLEKDPQRRIPTAMALTNRLKAMEHALSLETRVQGAADQGAESTGDSPSAAKPAGHTAISPVADVTAPLHTMSDQDYRIDGVPTGKVSAPDDASRAASTYVPGDPELALAPIEPPAKTAFTRVAPAELALRQKSVEADESGVRQWLLVGAVLAGLAVVLGGITYFATRPPSADRLYQSVKSAVEAGGAEELVGVEADLDRFLAAYPSDPRIAEMQGYRDDLALYRLQKRFELRARRLGSVEELLPVERAYLEAVQLAATDPAGALSRFKALIDVHSGPAEAGLTRVQQRASEQCLALAREQVERLGPLVEKSTAMERQAIRRELDRADTLAATDPAGAKRIRQGIVTLYADKKWSEDLVHEAQEKLKSSD
jgi:serine/threonine-protein kinase